MFPQVIFFTVFCGGPLVVEALGNCPVCPPLNPALFRLTVIATVNFVRIVENAGCVDG